MGGSLFSPELHTPRMPPHIYVFAREKVLKKLRKYYKHVDCPIEAPAKADYGDIDVLVYEPLVTQENLSDDLAIGALLGAKKWKRDRGSDEVHFALPWPGEFEDGIISTSGSGVLAVGSAIFEQISRLSVSDSMSAPETRATEQDKYIQLDLHICPNKEVHDWQLFRCAHGDFWTITGSLLRPFGLSFRYSGLYICIAELEKIHKKLSLVPVSGTPSDVLRFLFDGGVEEIYWNRGAFDSLEDMCDFIRQHCKFYRPFGEREKVDDEDGMEIEVQKTDKSRLTKRSSFRYWLEDYMPKHSPGDREADAQGEYAGMNREEVAEMVKERFGVTKQYEEKRKNGLHQVGVENLWADVRASIPPAKSLVEGIHGVQGLEVNFVVRTLRRKLSTEARDKKDEELNDMQRAYREGKFDEVNKWIKSNWKEVAEQKKAENEEKSRIHYKEKMKRAEKERVEAVAAAVASAGVKGSAPTDAGAGAVAIAEKWDSLT